MITIAVANQKGGVGKTTIAFNLAHNLAAKRKTVLAIDNDPQGNLTSSFLENPEELRNNQNILGAYDGIPLSPINISKGLGFLGTGITLAAVAERSFEIIYSLKEAVEPLGSKYDYCIIDCLPSFGYLHLAALNAADYVLIPVKPAPYALAGMNDLFGTIEKCKKRFNPELKVLGIVINQVDGRRPNIEREMEEALRDTYGELVFKGKINKRVKIEESPAFQKPIAKYAPKGKSALEFKAVTNEMMRRIKNGKIKQ